LIPWRTIADPEKGEHRRRDARVALQATLEFVEKRDDVAHRLVLDAGFWMGRMAAQKCGAATGLNERGAGRVRTDVQQPPTNSFKFGIERKASILGSSGDPRLHRHAPSSLHLFCLWCETWTSREMPVKMGR
jgi:hypothetical protein